MKRSINVCSRGTMSAINTAAATERQKNTDTGARTTKKNSGPEVMQRGEGGGNTKAK